MRGRTTGEESGERREGPLDGNHENEWKGHWGGVRGLRRWALGMSQTNEGEI